MTDQELQVVGSFVEACRNATPQEAVAKARELAGEWSQLERRGTLLLAELGVYHRRAADDPAVLEAAGCATLGEFEKTVLKAAHATIGLVSSSYKYFPELTPERFCSIGPVKMRKAIAAVKGKEYSAKERANVLEMVETATNVYSATNKLENGVIAGKGQLTQDSILLSGASVDVNELQEFCADEESTAYFETADPLLKVNRAIMESSSTWRRK